MLHRRLFGLQLLAFAFAFVAASVLIQARSIAAEPQAREMLAKAKRILLLGDSITYAGGYVANLDAWLLTIPAEQRPRLFGVGLPSETVSGLSENGHAGGQFPRPDVGERLDRVLEAVKPDLVCACYGINCGIYEPFDQGRLEKYQQGYISLKSKVEKAGAKLVILTPPFYDDQQAPKPFSYNAVLDKYSEWLLSQRNQGWIVFDLHSAMTKEVQKRRQSEPKFTFQPDGVHPNDEAHWFIASQLIAAVGDETAAAAKSPTEMLKAKGLPPQVLPLVQQRMAVIRDSYLSAAGHKRPGMAKGLPIAEAEAKAKALTAEIEKIIADAKK